MGLDSRDYLHNDFDDRRVTRPMSVVTRIIIVTAIVFLFQVITEGGARGVAGDGFIERWLVLHSDGLFQGHVWKLLTYAFLHDTRDVLHLVLNMFILYMMGRVTVPLVGEREFVWFYCASAIFAGICSVLFYRFLKIDPGVIGASGAVLAVFTLFALHYPRQRLYLFGVLPVEARWLLAAYVVFDSLPVISALSRGQLGVSGTAHSAHVGGILFAWLYFRQNMRFTRWWDRFAGRAEASFRARKTRLKVFNPKSDPEPDLSERVDEILAKISREGEASLTPRERRILRQASEQMKNRR